VSERIAISRRSFLARVGLGAGGLALSLYVRPARGAEKESKGASDKSKGGASTKPPKAVDPSAGPFTGGLHPNAFVHVAESGVVTIVCHRSEMGQGVRSSIPVLIADELGADMAKVVVAQAVGDKKYGDQNTDGSSSIRKFDERLRKIGAAARVMLIAAAAAQWKVDASTCTATGHAVVHMPTQRALPFGELAAAAGQLPVPSEKSIVLRPRSELRRVNSAMLPLLDGPAIADGSARFGSDVMLPGMLIAVIARPPVVGGKVARYDKKRALAVPGVRKIIDMPAAKKPYAFQPWGGVAVVADNTWAAMRGREALDITWDDGENAVYDSTSFKETLLKSVRAPGETRRKVGDVDAAFSKAAKVVEAEYLVPHLAQLPMEPPAAIARFSGGKCEIWASTQNPQAARKEAARVLGIDESAVTVNVTLLGGGFGRKAKADFVAEAAFVARAAKAPVRVQWTRSDDVRHCYYNAVNAQRLRAALDDKGKVLAWHQRTAYPPIGTTFGGKSMPSASDLQQGVLDLALDVPSIHMEACAAPSHVRVGWYRSVYNIFHAFSAGSFIDELAHARGLDPREMWLELIGPPRKLSLAELGIEKLSNYGETLLRHPVDAGRLRGVVERVTAASRWKGRKSDGRAFGLAAHRSFVAYSACVLSVVKDARRGVRCDEAWICIDAGAIVNRDRVHAQMEGAVVMGLRA